MYVLQTKQINSTQGQYYCFLVELHQDVCIKWNNNIVGVLSYSEIQFMNVYIELNEIFKSPITFVTKNL